MSHGNERPVTIQPYTLCTLPSIEICASALNPTQWRAMWVSWTGVTTGPTLRRDDTSAGFANHLDRYYINHKTIPVCTWSLWWCWHHIGELKPLHWDTVWGRQIGAWRWGVPAIIARECVRTDPLLDTDGVEHCLNPGQLSLGVLIQSYTHLSLMIRQKHESLYLIHLQAIQLRSINGGIWKCTHHPA